MLVSTLLRMTLAELLQRCRGGDRSETLQSSPTQHGPPYYHVSEHLVRECFRFGLGSLSEVVFTAGVCVLDGAQEALAPKLFEKLSSSASSDDGEHTVAVTSGGGVELTRRMVVREPGVEHPWTHNAGPVLRIGNRGSGHQAHYDLKHNVFLQLTGRKRFTLYVVL